MRLHYQTYVRDATSREDFFRMTQDLPVGACWTALSVMAHVRGSGRAAPVERFIGSCSGTEPTTSGVDRQHTGVVERGRLLSSMVATPVATSDVDEDDRRPSFRSVRGLRFSITLSVVASATVVQFNPGGGAGCFGQILRRAVWEVETHGAGWWSGTVDVSHCPPEGLSYGART